MQLWFWKNIWNGLKCLKCMTFSVMSELSEISAWLIFNSAAHWTVHTNTHLYAHQTEVKLCVLSFVYTHSLPIFTLCRFPLSRTRMHRALMSIRIVCVYYNSHSTSEKKKGTPAAQASIYSMCESHFYFSFQLWHILLYSFSLSVYVCIKLIAYTLQKEEKKNHLFSV